MCMCVCVYVYVHVHYSVYYINILCIIMCACVYACVTCFVMIISDFKQILHLQCWSDMEKRLGGDFPEKGSQREKEFIKGSYNCNAVKVHGPWPLNFWPQCGP